MENGNTVSSRFHHEVQTIECDKLIVQYILVYECDLIIIISIVWQPWRIWTVWDSLLNWMIGFETRRYSTLRYDVGKQECLDTFLLFFRVKIIVVEDIWIGVDELLRRVAWVSKKYWNDNASRHGWMVGNWQGTEC